MVNEGAYYRAHCAFVNSGAFNAGFGYTQPYRAGGARPTNLRYVHKVPDTRKHRSAASSLSAGDG